MRNKGLILEILVSEFRAGIDEANKIVMNSVKAGGADAQIEDLVTKPPRAGELDWEWSLLTEEILHWFQPGAISGQSALGFDGDVWFDNKPIREGRLKTDDSFLNVFRRRYTDEEPHVGFFFRLLDAQGNGNLFDCFLHVFLGFRR
jgi:hypothetical protein